MNTTTNAELVAFVQNLDEKQIRERLAVVDAEAASLRILLRTAIAKRRAAAKAAACQQEAGR